MTIYNIYIFDRNGTCLYYESWNRKKESNMSKEEEFKLMYGLKFILNTDLNAGSIKDVLFNIYSKIYVEYVVKNPLCQLNEPIQSELFTSKLDSYIRSLTIFN
ncbi:trafficking protein particle complex subunit 1-like isoform X2 [Pocillopora damicornis]|uniref:trafficking protein particle complex subunit 1-like isoform X2 n=1 Tax=Pocillopora damicornis TaxID=46731 RepID=UPI000F554CB6|nr:trafficking protein particle complex subunit 1-like isoform X2 [Pocillopora damicornis]XP_058972372.1 trafficking protein particle complex subunit 1-like isoform X3 [Pocillopora verrucosa]